jgi:hypothetical protein
MLWAAICWYSTGPITTSYVRIAASDHVDILGNHVHPMVQMFPNNCAVFQDDNSPELFSLGLRSMKMHFSIFRGQHSSPDLNIS